ncbi:MAG TPA: HAD hydrolase-like protein, partial [Modicisalibacter sp.]|nr:HAD hydrolase-like protein [Modicisalibacter sp.]
GKIAHIAYCPHGPDDQCDCRKPKTGLLIQIRQTLGMATLECAWMVGDSLRDLQAGMAMGCHPVLVRTGKGRDTETASELDQATVTVFDDLSCFVDWIEDSGL